MLTEGIRLLRQRQRTSLFMAQRDACASASLCALTLAPSPAGTAQWLGWMLCLQWTCVTAKKHWVCGITAFVACSKQACSLGVMDILVSWLWWFNWCMHISKHIRLCTLNINICSLLYINEAVQKKKKKRERVIFHSKHSRLFYIIFLGYY